MKHIGCCVQKSTEFNSVSACMLKVPKKLAYISWKGRIGVLVLMQLAVRKKQMY